MSSGRDTRPFRSFDDAEIMDDTRTAFNKQSIEELASDETNVTVGDALQRTRSTYDQLTGKMKTEFSVGVCSCGMPLEKNFAACIHGDLICGSCSRIIHNGRRICRPHIESYLGSKEEATVLLSIVIGMKLGEIKKASGLSEYTIREAKAQIEMRTYIKVSSVGFFSKKKITYEGIDALKTLVATFRQDEDFAAFLRNVGWSGDVERGKEQE